MADIALKRIRRDLKELIKSEEVAQCGIKVQLIDDNFYELKGEITGPPGTPYEGGTFELNIKIPNNYPFQPPEIRFATKVWHVNISSVNGFICLDILKDKWSACLTLRTILLSIQVLLSTPEPADPQDFAVARQLSEDPEMFELTARYWTSVHAGGPNKNQSFDDKMNKMMKLGICKNQSLAILSYSNWDWDDAYNKLLIPVR